MLLEDTEDLSRKFQHSYTGVEEHFFGDTFDARNDQESLHLKELELAIQSGYKINPADGKPHEIPTYVGEQLVRFAEVKEHVDEKITQEFNASVDESVVAYVKKAMRVNASKDVSPNYITIATNCSQRLIDAIYHITGIDVSDFTIAMKADAVIHTRNRHGENRKQDHSMTDINDYGRVGYVLNNLDALFFGFESDGKTPIYAQGYVGKNREGVPGGVVALTARKQVNGNFMVAHVAPDTKKKTIFITSAYKNKEVPKQENDAAKTATPVKRLKPTLNTGTSSGATISNSELDVKNVLAELLRAEEPDTKSQETSTDDINAARGRFDYASTMEISMYGNNGRVPVSGSPAHERGILPLSLHHVVEMYRLLTGIQAVVRRLGRSRG